MPNIEYDTRTPDEKKKLMKGKLKTDRDKSESEADIKETDAAGDDIRGNLHRHTA